MIPRLRVPPTVLKYFIESFSMIFGIISAVKIFNT